MSDVKECGKCGHAAVHSASGCCQDCPIGGICCDESARGNPPGLEPDHEHVAAKQPTRDVPQWEYLTVSPAEDELRPALAVLNTLGSEGWELVMGIPDDDDKPGCTELIFKRPKPERAPDHDTSASSGAATASHERIRDKVLEWARVTGADKTVQARDLTALVFAMCAGQSRAEMTLSNQRQSAKSALRLAAWAWADDPALTQERWWERLALAAGNYALVCAGDDGPVTVGSKVDMARELRLVASKWGEQDAQWGAAGMRHHGPSDEEQMSRWPELAKAAVRYALAVERGTQ